METRVAKRILGVIRKERDKIVGDLRRMAGKDHPYALDAAEDQWMFREKPFVNELCLLLLVWIRHELERDLVRMAARITSDGRILSPEEYRRRVTHLRELLRGQRRKTRLGFAARWLENLRRQRKPKERTSWNLIEETLQLKQFDEWKGALETLRLVINLYKHDPWSSPDEKLLGHLRSQLEKKGPNLQPFAAELLEHLKGRPKMAMEERQPFQALADSSDLMRGLAASLELEEPTDYCAITETFLLIVDEFLSKIKERSMRRSNWSAIEVRPVSFKPSQMAR